MENIFENIGFKIENIIHISGKEAIDCLKKGAVIVDIRELYDINYKTFDIVNLISIPKSKIELDTDILPKNKALIIADSFGINSKIITKFLFNKQFKNISNLIGGILEWEKDGLPIKKNLKEELNGPCMCMLKTRKKLMNK